MHIQLFNGKESFPQCSASVQVFYRKRSTLKELSIHEALKDMHSGLTQVQQEYIHASPVNKNYGYWVTSVGESEEGATFKIACRRKLHGHVIYETRFVMLRLRDQAALRRIRVELTGYENATMQCGYIEGRFDIITPDLFKDLGITDIPKGNIPFFIDKFGYTVKEYSECEGHPSDYVLEGFIQVEELEPEISAFIIPKVKEVKTISGKKLRIRSKKSRRVIRMK